MQEYFVEEFSFCEIGYDFKKFEGEILIKSTKDNFEVVFKNYDDLFSKDVIKYSIFIPLEYIQKDIEIVSVEEFEETLRGNLEKEDLTSDYACEILSEIRNDVEKDIFKYLQDNGLVEEIVYE